MFKVGGVTFSLVGILFLLALSGVALLGTIPSSSISSGLIYINSHAGYFELAYSSQLVAGFLLFPSVFAVFLALRHTNRTWASTGLGMMVVGIPIFLVSATQAFTVLSLARSYLSASNDPAQSAAILGAGLGSLTNMGLLATVTDSVFAVGSIINGILFMKSPYFGRVLGGLVISGSILTFVGAMFVPALALAILLFAVAFLIAGWKLFEISKRSVPL